MVSIRRGSTATITCHIPEDIDMTSVDNVWLFIAQKPDGRCSKVIIDRSYAEHEIDKDDET